MYKEIWKELEGKSKEEKIKLLKDFSTMKVGSPTKRKFHFSFQKCSVCRGSRSYCQHHIILLRNGGDDSKLNRLPICSGCHKEIHDWL